MFKQTDQSNSNQRGMLSVIMFGVLLASMVAAWFIVAKHAAPGRVGAEIIREIRRNTLPAYFSRESLDTWFLGKDEGDNPKGWRAVSRKPTADGFRGSVMVHLPGMIILEHWTISSDVSIGQYEGIASGEMRGKTLISLKGNRISVVQRTVSGKDKAASPVPENYIPEGLLELVVQLVARGGQKAAFKIIMDDNALDYGYLRFTEITMTPLTGRDVRVEYKFSRGVISKLFRLDDEWGIAEVITADSPIRFERVSLSELLHFLPESRKYYQPTPAPPASAI